MDNDVFKNRLMILLKSDAEDLFRRLNLHLEESVSIMNLKRSRDHFKDLFRSRYPTFTAGELKLIDEASIVAVVAFYREVDELNWYLLHTQDQPQMILNHCEKAMLHIRGFFDTLKLHLEAELDPATLRDEDILDPAVNHLNNPINSDNLESYED